MPVVRRSALRLALGTALVLAVPGVVVANMADPFVPGDVLGEPSPGLAGLVVEHESLRVDLRGEPTVEAVYQIRNDSTRREVALEFVALGLYSDYGGDRDALRGDTTRAYTVSLDGAPVPAEPTDSLLVPIMWLSGLDVPSPDGSTLLATTTAGAFEVGEPDTTRASGLRFRLAVEPGVHTVRVRYPVRLAGYEGTEHVHPTRLFAYSLAPARRWAGFGRLDVEVLLPPGVDAASTPDLARDGDRLTGSFDGLPADVLGVSFREPAPVAVPLLEGLALLWLGLGLVGVPALLGVRAARRGRSWKGALVVGPLAALAALAGYAALRVGAISFAETAYGYGFALGGVLLAIPALLAGSLLAGLLFATARGLAAKRLRGVA